MGTLPDLETQTAGHVAFYNLIEQADLTQESLTWSDVVNNGNLTDYKPFDNGVILDYSDSAFGTIKIRCKTDGWVVAYTGWDGSVNTGSSSKATNSGACLTVNSVDSTNSITNNRLVNAMENIMSDLSDWNLANFSRSGIGFYEFAYGSDGISYFYEAQGLDSSATRTVSKTSTTNVNAIHAVGHADSGATSGANPIDSKVLIDGSTLVEDTSVFSGVKHGHADGITSMETSGDVQIEFSIEDDNGPQSHPSAGASVAAYWGEQ